MKLVLPLRYRGDGVLKVLIIVLMSFPPPRFGVTLDFLEILALPFLGGVTLSSLVVGLIVDCGVTVLATEFELSDFAARTRRGLPLLRFSNVTPGTDFRLPVVDASTRRAF